MEQIRDYQQSRVYRWQAKHLPNGGTVHITNAQAIVNHIWSDFGLEYPPIVEQIDVRTKKWAGKANRLTIWLQSEVSLRTIIHEVAHSMTSNVYGESAQHGPIFMGVYSKLLQKFLDVDVLHIIQTCAIENVDIDINASPIFTDEGA